MAQQDINQPNHPTPQPKPAKPDQDQSLHPGTDTEINPSIPGTQTEVDLDKHKTKTYPGTKPPERH